MIIYTTQIYTNADSISNISANLTMRKYMIVVIHIYELA
jgi:hypothetical protein